MSKSVKSIIAAVLVLAALGGGFAALKLTDPERNNGDSSITETTTDMDRTKYLTLIQDEKAEKDPETGVASGGVIHRITVTNEHGSMTVVETKETEKEDNPEYTFEGYEDVSWQVSVVGTLANNANLLTSTDIIEENASDLGKYGLDKPAITLDAEYRSGSETKLLIGDDSPSGKETYVAVEGSNTVYTVLSTYLANFRKGMIEFANNTILATPDQDNYPNVLSLRIEREDLDYDIYIEHDKRKDDPDFTSGTSASSILVEPVEAYLNMEKSVEITNGMFGLMGESVYSIDAKESDIAETGLKDPFCRVTMKTDDNKTNVLLLSEPFNDEDNGKCCYGMLEGGKAIYTIKAEKAKWLTVMPIDITARMFIGEYVWNITALTVEGGGKKYDFKITAKDPEKKEGLSSDDFTTTMNGAEFDTERYRQFYAFVIGANAEEFAFEEKVPEGEPMARIVYTENYYNKPTTVEFYDYSNLKSLVVINGESRFIISKGFVETLIDNIGRIEGEEDYVKTWR